MPNIELMGRVVKAELIQRQGHSDEVQFEMRFQNGTVDGYLSCRKPYEQCKLVGVQCGVTLRVEIEVQPD